jgi:hypothetical protein
MRDCPCAMSPNEKTGNPARPDQSWPLGQRCPNACPLMSYRPHPIASRPRSSAWGHDGLLEPARIFGKVRQGIAVVLAGGWAGAVLGSGALATGVPGFGQPVGALMPGRGQHRAWA